MLPFPPTPRKRFIFIDTIWLGGSHDGYPLTSFSEYMKVRSAPSRSSDPIAYAALYQSLCTFGLLESVMEVKISESSLLRQDAEGKIVMTDKYLPDMLQNWRQRIRRSDESCQCQWAKRVQISLQQLYDLLQIDVFHGGYRDFFVARTDVSIYLLIACIAEAVTLSHYVFPSSARTQSTPRMVLPPPAIDHMTKIMISNGWCPFIITILSQNVCTFSYASTRKPYVRDTVEEHHKCKPTACVINMIDTSSYSNRHAVEGCTCAYSKLSLDTTEVGLPTCQINRLVGIARRLIPSGAFWMDALCVPSKRDLRRRAIGLMAETYRNADAVLVIDCGIRSCSVSAPLEKLLYIISSGWMQRLWTLQEALLVQNLIFEFADGFATLDELIPKGEDLLDVPLALLSAEIFRLTKYQRFATSDGYGIGDVARSLRQGTETLAISGLLNVDAFELVSLPASQRMMTLLLRVQKLPSDIIFIPGPRLNESGFRWAPRTMMTSIEASISDITLKPGALWFLRDMARQRIYQLVDMSSDIEEYSCNGLLLMDFPRPSQTVRCIACRMVVREAHPEDTGGDRFTCEYQQRLLLTDISESKLTKQKTATVSGARSGRMRVLVT
ncbi:hypothetical protein EDD18DRAFT_1160471 [Armillaria luteobubalina]|uniref:Heterokaryon incompatibility domain-containing protein n=1 Tax=Armillaria luteobubalina TaxID=153913 RepID=A0AA39UY91_9AGAR|nr:hypothetical protein EDD18DRAFT_1160471 [Armillaria luteobubalina]